ncbi:MAG: cadherin-like domain-containing protein [Phycisphaerae bacterium]|nr:cadherin-like domain-containing protein [Phycisphaerae bacterium]
MSQKQWMMVLLISLAGLAAADVGPTWIEQWGIRWTFDKNISLNGAPNTYRYGQFVNGDYWVVGPVNITGISPEFRIGDGATEFEGWAVPDGWHINGSMINPRAMVSTQGYTYNSVYGSYNSALNVGIGVSGETPLAVPVGSSLVSTKSRSRTGPGGGQGGSDSDVKTAAVLTVLAEAPPADSFRPPYCGLVKTLYRADNLQRERLTSLTSVSGTPNIEDVAALFQKPWICHLGGWSGKYIFPVDSIPTNYGREIHRDIGIAALMLNLDYTEEQKEPLLINFVQRGIDLYGIVADGGITHWGANGGHMGGRKWPILFAGLMLDDAAMKGVGAKSGAYLYSAKPGGGNYGPGGGYGCPVPLNRPSDYIHFGEDDQTFHIAQLDVDLTDTSGPYGDVWRPDTRDAAFIPYPSSDIGVPEWGVGHALRPHVSNYHYSAAYRSVATLPFAGTALAALIMNAKTLWNHDAYFDYTDRHMTLTASGGEWSGKIGRTNSAFLTAMWDTYRADYGPIWPSKASAGTGNNAPVIAPISAKTVTAGQKLEFVVMATDADNDVLSYSASGLPLGSLFSIATKTFNWTPGSAQTGVFTVTFSVSDGKGGTATATVSITVNPPPDYILSISSANGSVTKRVNGVVTTATSFAHGTVVSLTAAPNTGYTFASWSGSVTSTNNPVSITMDGNRSVTANFTPIAVPTYTVTFNLDGKGTRTGGGALTQTIAHGGAAAAPTVTANTGWVFAGWDKAFNNITGNLTVNAVYTAQTYTVTFNLDGKGTRTGGGALTQTVAHGSAATAPTVVANTGWVFAGWDKAFNNITSNLTVNALYTQQTYTLGITAANGSVTKRVNGVVTTATSFAHGTVVSLTATANTGYTFANWSGSASGTANPVSITMDGNKAVTVNFTQNTYTLGITANNGSVTKRVNGVVTTATSFAHGTVVSLTAAPNTGYTFANWSGNATGTANPISITMDGNKAVTANFTQNTYTLGITATNGSVTKRVNGVITTATSFAHGTVVSLTAAPNTGYTFANWSGSASGTANPVSITMDGNKAVTANFTQNTYTLAITATNGSVTKRVNGVITTATSFAHGTIVSLTAAANTGYTFANWSGSATGTANPVSITMDANKAVTANFAQVSLDLNPVAQWLFNEPYQATAIDLVSGQPASLINDPEWGEGWAQEHFVRLGSAQQAVQVPMSECRPQAGTVALWVMPQASNGTQYLFGHTFNGANRIALYTVFTANGNALTLGMGNTIALHQNIAILSPDVLYHIVLTWNNGSYAVYVDGIEAAAGSYSGLNALNTYADVGNYGNAATRTLGFRGLVEEVQLHSRALAPSEVQALFLTHNVKENRPIQFVVNGTDGLGNPISYTASNLPQGATFDFATQTFSWRPALYNTAGRYEIFLSAPGQPTETVTIAVQDVQRAGWYEAFLAHLGLN